MVQPTKPATPAVRFSVNGEACTFAGDAQTPLLWVLRDTLKLTGTKFVRHRHVWRVHRPHGWSAHSRLRHRGVGRCRQEHRDHRRPRSSRWRASPAGGLEEAPGAAVRLLPERADHAGGGACWPHVPKPRTPRSRPTWKGSCADAGRTSAFAPPSRSAGREAGMRSPTVLSRRAFLGGTPRPAHSCSASRLVPVYASSRRTCSRRPMGARRVSGHPARRRWS